MRIRWLATALTFVSRTNASSLAQVKTNLPVFIVQLQLQLVHHHLVGFLAQRPKLSNRRHPINLNSTLAYLLIETTFTAPPSAVGHQLV